jgi:branched-chain amino acid transport system substrate-binding protein
MENSVRRFTAAAALALAGTAHADISNNTVKLGVLTDLSSVYSDYAGEGSVVAARLAVEDFGGSVNGKKIEIVFADFQNKADVSLSIARKWIDEQGVDVLVDAPNSAVAAALAGLAREKNKVYLIGAVSSDLTGKFCTPNTMQFTPDSYSLAAVAGQALVKQGLKSWYSVTVDYALGHALERDAFSVVKANGGTAVGSVRHPFGATDMSSFVLQAQASNAQVVSLASAGADVQSLLRAISEYGVNKDKKIVSLNTELLDSYKVGRKLLAGTYLTDAWYWDANDENRAFAKRYGEKHPKHFMPARGQAGIYAMVTEYLRAVKALDDDSDGKAIVAKIRSAPLNDLYTKGGYVREDGRLITEMMLVQVKGENEPKTSDWDLYKIVSKVPGEKAFRPVAESECPLLKK